MLQSTGDICQTKQSMCWKTRKTLLKNFRNLKNLNFRRISERIRFFFYKFQEHHGIDLYGVGRPQTAIAPPPPMDRILLWKSRFNASVQQLYLYALDIVESRELFGEGMVANLSYGAMWEMIMCV